MRNLITTLSPFIGASKEWQLDSLFDESFANIFNSLNTDPYPTDQYYDKANVLHLEIPLAGYKKDDIKLSIKDEYLHLKVSKQEKVKDVKYVAEGIRKKELTRQWYVDDNFETDNITTSFVDGLLRISIPSKKLEAKVPKSREIAVS